MQQYHLIRDKRVFVFLVGVPYALEPQDYADRLAMFNLPKFCFNIVPNTPDFLANSCITSMLHANSKSLTTITTNHVISELNNHVIKLLCTKVKSRQTALDSS